MDGRANLANELVVSDDVQKNEDKGRSKVLLQHFEFATLSEVSRLGKMAFPAEITRSLSFQLGRRVALAQVFVALERLEDKGLVTSREERPEPVRGGRRRRVFQLEASGAQAIRNTAAAFRTSSSGFSEEMMDAQGHPRPIPT